MSQGKRPGGLTALAVLNFVFGGFGVIGFLGLLAVLALITAAATGAAGSGTEEGQAASAALKNMPMGLFYLTMGLYGLSTFLLIASGVGYIQQKKFLGRTLGSTYGVLAVLSALIGGLMLPDEGGGGFGLFKLVGLIYPVLTLMLLNTTFKDDFTR